MTFTGSLNPAPSIMFTPPSVGAVVPDSKVVEKVVSTPPPKTRWRRIVSFSTLFNLFLVYVLVSLAQEVQKLRSEVQFIADEQRDLRLYGGYDRANSRGWVERQTTERWEDSAVRSEQQAKPQPPPRNEDEQDPNVRNNPGQGTTEPKPERTPVNSENAHQTQSAGSHSVVSATNPNYGLGRVVVKRMGWMDWIDHPS